MSQSIKSASQRHTLDGSGKDNNNWKQKNKLVIRRKEEAKNFMFWLEKYISKVENALL